MSKAKYKDYEDVSEKEEYSEDEAQYEESVDETEEEHYVDEKSARRVARRKRRIRNQIIAYLVLILLVAGIAGGGIFALSKVLHPSSSKPSSSSDGEEVASQEYDGSLIEIQAPEIALHYPEVVEPSGEQEVAGANPFDELAMNYISQMTLEEKVAGLFFTSPESMMDGVDQAVVAGGKTETAMSTYSGIGGIVYTTKNIQSVDQISQMIEKTKGLSKYPLFMGIREEGGTVNDLSAALSDAPKTPSAQEMGATGDASGAYANYTQLAQYMTKLGFNVNFAPNGNVSDAKTSFSGDPDVVASFVYQSASALQDNNVHAAIVGFPGMGSAEGSVKDGRATVSLGEEEMVSSDLLPYSMAVSSGADIIMVNQAAYPTILGDYTPAFMSPYLVSNVLRGNLGYNGLIITEPMNTKAVTEYYSSAEASINAINAGCDMLLLPENFKDAYNGLLAAVQNGEISESRIEESLLRIYRVKLKF